MTADVQTECDKGDGVGECKPSRIADIEAERTLLSPFVVLLRVGSLLVHAMDVNAPDACRQAETPDDCRKIAITLKIRYGDLRKPRTG